MPFTTLVYNNGSVGTSAASTDLTAATDGEFSQRNSHYIFTEQYQLLAAALVGASVTRGRFQAPRWNAIGEFHLFNANRSLQPPANPQWDDWSLYPLQVPMYEEFQVQVSGNLSMGTEINNAVLQLATPDWNRNLPRGLMPLLLRGSFTLTPTANAWSALQTITLSTTPTGGVYSVCGAALQGSNAVAFRLVFPRARTVNNRKMRPGSLTQNAVGDALNNQIAPWVFHWGEWGRFHTFELPQVEVFGTAANSTTFQLFLWTVYMGQDQALVTAY